MSFIRNAQAEDIGRICEIEVFNYRLNFYPIFKDDGFYFREYTVEALKNQYEKTPSLIQNTFVYDDGCVKGFIRFEQTEIKKLFVEPVLQGKGIGNSLIAFALSEKNARYLWALEKNKRAIAFYEKHGFQKTGERKNEEDTDEFLIRLERG